MRTGEGASLHWRAPEARWMHAGGQELCNIEPKRDSQPNKNLGQRIVLQTCCVLPTPLPSHKASQRACMHAQAGRHMCPFSLLRTCVHMRRHTEGDRESESPYKHSHLEVVLPQIVKDKAFSRTLAFIIAAALSNGVDIPPVLLRLGMLQGITIHL